MITLVLGGARSGKSAVAERLALRSRPGSGTPVVYLATAVADAADADLAERIGAHQARRGDDFSTLEVGADLVAALHQAGGRPVLVDALGTWLAGCGDDFAGTAARLGPDLVAALVARTAPTVVVSDEVGLGVHPSSEVGRHFRDALGLVNQQVAAVADDVVLVVAGRALRLAPIDELDGP